MSDAYAKAPITEAVIEMRTSDAVTEAALRKAQTAIRKRYKKSEKLVQFTLDLAVAASARQEFAGFKLTSDGGEFVAQAKVNGLSFSVLAPYPGWTAFLAEFEEVWRLWSKAVGRKPIARIGVRFLNRIDIPQGEDELLQSDDYLNVGVKLPDITRDGALGWQAAAVSQIPNTPFKLRVGCGQTEPALINHAAYLLDLDLFCDVDVPQTDNDIWSLLSDAKVVKNRVFEECITSRTRTLIS